jgi:SAM-dependent methyltransferase
MLMLPKVMVNFIKKTYLHMAYYDSIAKQWHEATGYKGGAFKELVLNSILLDKVPAIDNHTILELGAGNGYFLPLVLRCFSGQVPAEVVITDKSEKLLQIAQRHFRIVDATYQLLDVCKPFPFVDQRFDIIIASMIFNEVPAYCLKHALSECYRVLKKDGILLMAVIHPAFVASLQKRELLKPSKDGLLTMPGAGSLRLPVVIRSIDNYRSCLTEAKFQYEEMEAALSEKVLNVKSGLRNMGNTPIALVYKCNKAGVYGGLVL